MRFLTLTLAAITAATGILAAEGEQVQVRVDRAVECERKTKVGDKISVHYRGTLQATGKQFDASYDRGQPLEFVVGKGSVIEGWDKNLIDMCIGEKRTLTIPPEFGYGSRDMGPIPASSTLIFETELMGIAGVESPKSIVEKTTSSVVAKATDAIKDAAKDKLADAAEAVKVMLTDTDAGGQEHNEL
ncbi:hypothetical protein K3495_g10719 [Podosphaera aphanis]|nr:hypothetical protein K3495_g10719 [Podosphaera aphanis]